MSQLSANARPAFVYLFVWILLFGLSTVPDAIAEERIWDGGAANGFWTDPINWQKDKAQTDIAPNPGDSLIFPTNAARLVNTNSFPNNTIFDSIRFQTSGYSIFGNSVTLNSGIQIPDFVGGTNSFWPDVTLSQAQTFELNGTLEMGRLFGSAGADLAKAGRSTLILHSNSPYSGTISVNGTLVIKEGLPNSAIIVGGAGTLQARGAIGPLTVNGGQVALDSTSGETLEINGNLTLRSGIASSAVLTLRLATNGSSDQLSVIGTVSLNDVTYLNLMVGSLPSPGARFTIIENDGDERVIGGFFELSAGRLLEGSSFLAGLVRFMITYRGGDGNDVVLTVSGYGSSGRRAVWTGLGTDSFWSNPANWLGNSVPKSGDNLYFPSGPTRLNTTNDFGSNSLFHTLSFSGINYSLAGNPIILNGGIFVSNTSGQTAISLPLDLVGSQVFSNNSVLLLSGDINVHDLLTFGSTADLSVAGSISGDGGLVKTGSGVARLLNSNGYSGPTAVNEGSLVIDGSELSSAISVQHLATLSGIGQVGTIDAAGAVAPGDFSQPGILSSASLHFSPGGSLSILIVGGVLAGSDYSQLRIADSIDLNNAQLTLLIGNAPAFADSLMIIRNDGADPVSGTFALLPEGASINVGSVFLTISYVGGDGNDVVLHRPAPPSRIDSIVSLGNGTRTVRGTGLPNLTYTIDAVSNLRPGLQWQAIGSSQANANGIYLFTDLDAPNYPRRFYRARSP